MILKRREFMKSLGFVTSGLILSGLNSLAYAGRKNKKSNIVIIFADDLGYGDLSSFGHPTIKTPCLDKMASEGQKWTNFYAAASVCTPSRAGLLTGRLPIRNGMCSDKLRVLFPNSTGGLPEDEITIAEALKTQGYATGCVGKWHLGHLPQYLPTNNGFDSYFGIPYSNDMDWTKTNSWRDAKAAMKNPKTEYWNVPLMRNEEIVERPANQNTITKRYTEESIKFIKDNKNNPFFLYLAHNLPHVPLFASKKFQDKSVRGLYGDVIEEIDWGVGQILDTLKKEGIAKNTLVVFTSDNGPWLVFDEHGGSAGLLKDGKGTTWEGGMREPTIFWQPGKIKPGIVTDIGSTLDLFTTACKLGGTKIPDDRIIDGLDLCPTLFDEKSSPRKIMFYYRGTKIYAVRKGMFKAHFITETAYAENDNLMHHDPPLLFHLGHDPSEKYNIAEKYPEIIEDIKHEIEVHQSKLVIPESQLEKHL